MMRLNTAVVSRGQAADAKFGFIIHMVGVSLFFLLEEAVEMRGSDGLNSSLRYFTVFSVFGAYCVQVS